MLQDKWLVNGVDMYDYMSDYTHALSYPALQPLPNVSRPVRFLSSPAEKGNRPGELREYMLCCTPVSDTLIL